LGANFWNIKAVIFTQHFADIQHDEQLCIV